MCWQLYLYKPALGVCLSKQALICLSLCVFFYSFFLIRNLWLFIWNWTSKLPIFWLYVGLNICRVCAWLWDITIRRVEVREMSWLKHGGVIGSHRRGRTLYKKSFSGSQLVDWLQKEKGMGKRLSDVKCENSLDCFIKSHSAPCQLLTLALCACQTELRPVEQDRFCCRGSAWSVCMGVEGKFGV